MGMKIGDFERLDRRLVKKAHIFDIYEDTLKLPDGRIAIYDFLGHKGAAAVLPVLPNGDILMVRQFRNALDRYTWEVPAGGRNTVDEEYITAARRELEEETGYKSDNLVHLINIRTAVAFCNEQIQVFVAKDLVKTEQNLDEDEFIDVKSFSLDELNEMIKTGEIEDSKTIAVVMAYQVLMKNN